MLGFDLCDKFDALLLIIDYWILIFIILYDRYCSKFETMSKTYINILKGKQLDLIPSMLKSSKTLHILVYWYKFWWFVSLNENELVYDVDLLSHDVEKYKHYGLSF